MGNNSTDKRIEIFIDPIPNDKLKDFPSSENGIYNPGGDFRLHMQGISADPTIFPCCRLQVQINRRPPGGKSKGFARLQASKNNAFSTSRLLVPVDAMKANPAPTPQQIKDDLKAHISKHVGHPTGTTAAMLVLK